MEAVVFPVLQTSLNAAGLIQACREMQQPNPTAKPDQRRLHGLKPTIETLNEIQRRPYLTANIVSLGYMLITHHHDMPSVLTHTAGMPHIYHDGYTDASCVIVTGSLQQWLTACQVACQTETDQVVRFVFNRVYRNLEQTVPREMLSGGREDHGDGTFLLLASK